MVLAHGMVLPRVVVLVHVILLEVTKEMSLVTCKGHTAWVPEGRQRHSQAGPKGPKAARRTTNQNWITMSLTKLVEIWDYYFMRRWVSWKLLIKGVKSKWWWLLTKTERVGSDKLSVTIPNIVSYIWCANGPNMKEQWTTICRKWIGTIK